MPDISLASEWEKLRRSAERFLGSVSELVSPWKDYAIMDTTDTVWSHVPRTAVHLVRKGLRKLL